jgi:hypothetical protein
VAGARYSWLLELKYLRTGAKPAEVAAAFAEAESQVSRYASDEALSPLLLDGRELRAGVIVFVGTRKPLFRAWPLTSGAKPATEAPCEAREAPVRIFRRRGAESAEGPRADEAWRVLP